MVDSVIVQYVLSYGGAAGLTLILVLLGLLVPKAYHQRVLADNEKLQAANAKLQEALELERDNASRLGNSSQLTNQLITALVRMAQDPHPPPPGGPAVILPPTEGP